MIVSDSGHGDEVEKIKTVRNEMTYEDATYQKNVGNQGIYQGDEALKLIFNHHSTLEIEKGKTFK